MKRRATKKVLILNYKKDCYTHMFKFDIKDFLTLKKLSQNDNLINQMIRNSKLIIESLLSQKKLDIVDSIRKYSNFTTTEIDINNSLN